MSAHILIKIVYLLAFVQYHLIGKCPQEEKCLGDYWFNSVFHFVLGSHL